MTPLELTENVVALISDPMHWTQGHAAITKNGTLTEVTGKHAYAWCSIGAIWRFEWYGSNQDVVKDAFSNKAKELFPDDIHYYSMVNFNDNHTHEEVMRVWNAVLKDYRDAEER